MDRIGDEFIHMLKSINLLCESMEYCDDCPYYVKRKDLGFTCCFFLQPFEGRSPLEWDVHELTRENKEGYNGEES